MSKVAVGNSPTTKGAAKIVYILYLVSLLFGITGIIGVVMAYINKDDAPEWVQTHYQFQIRTFWIGALFIFWFNFICNLNWLVFASVLGGLANSSFSQRHESS